ncbi:hypothetical protein D5H78_07185 [Vallicoccus soli]|uniref:Uncharacterized protein n=1 Tax=Vallicoccus soli TaxID=2339232 RepID=A0A3A3ZLQ9_9ACTN|nr:hypothetical protein D5H78_07185 [Vallicoccus soli]
MLLAAGPGWDRLPWHEVLAATWDDERGALAVESVRGAREVVLGEPGLLPETVRERVQSSIVLTRHVPVLGRRGVRVVARRVPGRDGLLWQEVADPGVDPADPRVRAAVDLEQRRLRAAML